MNGKFERKSAKPVNTWLNLSSEEKAEINRQHAEFNAFIASLSKREYIEYNIGRFEERIAELVATNGDKSLIDFLNFSLEMHRQELVKTK